MQVRLKTVSVLALATAGLAAPSTVSAQVAPTEVNEKAVDDFGLERKTGRFQWSGAPVIAVGGEGSQISVVATSIRNPAWAQTTWPARSFNVVNTNEPQLVSFPLPNENSPIPGAVHLDAANRTVSFPGGSESFKCQTTCYSEYFTGSTLEDLGTSYVYTDTQGVKVYFEEDGSRIVYPDGRETTYSSGVSGKFRKNNFGFMLKQGGASIQAVNQVVDYCQEDSVSSCTGLSASRTATIASPSVGLEEITNADGEVTKLRWGTKVAKRYRRPQGFTGYIPDDNNIKYPLGITLPGSTSEDITISYNAHDPAMATHDEISVSSITKHGVTASYQIDRVYPYGLSEVSPAIQAAETLDQREGDPIQRDLANLDAACASQGAAGWVTRQAGAPGFYSTSWESLELPGADFACQEANSIRAVQEAVAQIINNQSIGQLPANLRELEEPGSLGSEVYNLTITSTVAGQPAGESYTLKPAGLFASNRRRLMYITDASGRKTNYFYNHLEEVTGTTYPEGNGVFKAIDGRGNVTHSINAGKPVLDPAGDIQTNDFIAIYTYAPDCTNIPLARCNKPLTATDPNGNTTEFTYNDRGQVLTEKKPAPTAGAARPTVVNEYTMRTAYIKDANGSPVAAGQPISLMTKSFTCISSVTCNASTSASDKVVTEYDYGPATGLNNLDLRGVAVTAANVQGNMETLRTCYSYNYFGEKISETQPKAGLAVCP